MNDRDFVYWLHGFFELSGSDTLSTEQVEMIQRHLELALKNIEVSLKQEEPMTTMYYERIPGQVDCFTLGAKCNDKTSFVSFPTSC